MNSFARVIAQEIRLLRREGLALWAMIGLLVLVLAAGVNGRALLAAQQHTSTALHADTDVLVGALAAQAARGVPTATEPGALGFGVLVAPAILPTAPLAPLAVGQSDLLPGSYPVTARGEHTYLSRAEIDNPLRLSIGNFDVAFVIVWLLPLVVIALTFNVVSAERERGVLALAVAAGASPARFILGKCAARGIILLVAIWVALFAAALAAGVPLGRPAGLLPMLVWSLAAVLYAAFWFALALWINSRLYASDQNASILAGAWLLLVIIAPTLTNLAATALFPAPSRVELTTELREASEAADREAAKTRDRYFFDHPDMQSGDMDKTAYYQSVARSEASVARDIAPHLAAFDAQAQRQQRLVAALQYLSPGTVSYQLLTTLAGSDGARHREFRSQVHRFHDQWTDFFVVRIMQGKKLTRDDYQALPKFQFVETPLAIALRRVTAPLLALLILVICLLFLAIRRLSRLSVV